MDETWPWRPQPASVNLEGALTSETPVARKVLFNHSSILPALTRMGVAVADIGNNHICDLDNGVADTVRDCAAAGIACLGAGATTEAASRPVRLVEEGREIVLLSWGWHVIGCRGAKEKMAGVNLLRPGDVLRQAASARASYPNARLICQFHWNFEMELYPQPAHRQLAFSLIEAGADAVIGHHPHRVGGFERYEGKPIVYSLGNWWVPQGVFWAGKLRYTADSYTQLAFELDGEGTAVAHRYMYAPDTHSLSHLDTMPADECGWLADLTPFAGMTHREYVRWFPSHRIKRKLLPVYADWRHETRNRMRDGFVALRQVGVNGIKSALSGRRNA